MDINSIPIVSGTTQAYRQPATQPANTDQVPIVTARPYTAVNANETGSSRTVGGQAQYEAALRAAASASFNYPLGSKQFSIFKDASGQLVTRYVSLLDGSVQYVPSPVYVKSQVMIDA